MIRRTRPGWRWPAAIGAVLAVPLALAVSVDMSDDATGLLALVGLAALLVGGVTWEAVAGLSARRRGAGVMRPVVAATASYFIGASIVLSIAWLVALRWTTIRGFDVSTSVGVGALASLWIAAAISAGVVVLVVGASSALWKRPPQPS